MAEKYAVVVLTKITKLSNVTEVITSLFVSAHVLQKCE